MNLYNISIKKKAYIALAFIGVTIIVTMVFMTVNLSRVESEFITFKDKAALGKIHTLEIERDMNYISRCTRDIFLGNDYDKNVVKIQGRIKSIDAKYEIVLKTAKNKNEREDIERARTSTMAFVTFALEHVLSLRTINRTSDVLKNAYKEYKERGTPLANQSREYFPVVIKNKNSDFDMAVSTLSDEISLLKRTLLINGFLIFLFGLLPVIVLLRYIIASLTSMRTTFKKVEAEKDFTKEIEKNLDDEIGETRDLFNELLKSLRITLNESKKSSQENRHLAVDLFSASKEISSMIHKEHDLVSSTNKTGQEAKELLNRSMQITETTYTHIEKVGQNLSQVIEKIIHLSQSIQKSAAEETELSQRLQQVSRETQEVTGVLTVISEIADQTNLLALNAAIEAARAGEHGRGFAVVADEVRKLAEKTQSSLNEINSSINAAVEAVEAISTTMNLSAEKTKELSDTSRQVSATLSSTTSLMREARDAAHLSLENAHTLTERVTSMVDNVQEINTISDENDSEVQKITSASKHVEEIAESIDKKLNQFKT